MNPEKLPFGLWPGRLSSLLDTKLALFVSRPAEVLRQIPVALAKSPMAWMALAAAAGILLSDFDAGHVWLWSIAGLICAVDTMRRPKTRKLVATLMMTFGLIHQVCLMTSRDHPLRSFLKRSDRVTATIRGRFIEASMTSDDNPGWRKAVFEMDEMDLPTRQKRISGTAKVRVWLPDHQFVPQSGLYELEGHFNLAARGWNPGIFDPEVTALQKGIIGELSVSDSRLLKADPWGIWLPMLEFAERSRVWIEQKVTQGIEDDPLSRTLITTMALGTAQAGNDELEEPFRNSGTIHIFAVSGLHVGLVGIIVWQLLKVTRIGRARALFIVIPTIVGYAFVTGWVPSAARSAIMSCVMLLAPLINRQSRLLNSLGLAALVLLAGDTLELFQPGFQLSFAVLAAISLLARPFARPFETWTQLDPFLPPVLATPVQRAGVWFREHLLTSVSTSFAAWLGSLPFLMGHFHTCTPISIFANMVLVPLSFAALFTITLTVLAAVAHAHAVVVCLNQANWLFAHLMMLSATCFSSVPGGHFPLHTSSFASHPAVTLSVLSMPPGEAANLLSSDGSHWMLDCGGSKHFRKTVLSFLRHESIAAIDGLIASHGDAEHIGGALSLLQGRREVPVMVGMHEPWRLDSRATAMWQLAREHRDQLLKLRAGDVQSIGGARIKVLFPSPIDVHDKADDRCLVARIDVGEMRILWCSDAGFLAEKALLDRFPAGELRSHVMIRNQNRADWSALPEFLMAVQPAVIVSSNAPAIAEERLPNHLRSDCQRLGIKLMDLNETGMVRIEVDEGKAVLTPWLAGKRLELDASSHGLASGTMILRSAQPSFSGD